MISRFVQVDRHTAYLLPPSVQDWLPEDHLARYMVQRSGTVTIRTSTGMPRAGCHKVDNDVEFQALRARKRAGLNSLM